MSKISEFNLTQKEISLLKLEQTANNAILSKSNLLWIYVTGYAQGLIDAYYNYMDETAIEDVRALIMKKQKEFLKEEELN